MYIRVCNCVPFIRTYILLCSNAISWYCYCWCRFFRLDAPYARLLSFLCRSFHMLAVFKLEFMKISWDTFFSSRFLFHSTSSLSSTLIHWDLFGDFPGCKKLFNTHHSGNIVYYIVRILSFVYKLSSCVFVRAYASVCYICYVFFFQSPSNPKQFTEAGKLRHILDTTMR